MKNITQKIIIETNNTLSALDLLHLATNISKTKLKDAMNKGAVWEDKSGRKKRIRRAKKIPAPGSVLECYYDEALLLLVPPEGRIISNEGKYSVWFKPAGLMTQGTMFGDHCSLLRQAERHFSSKKAIFPVNRLDRETAGILLLAHSKQAAATLSELFQQRKVKKKYLAIVKGQPGSHDEFTRISNRLDGKEAITEYRQITYDEKKDESLVEVYIKTGRRHQIRRHFHIIGFPVMGDPQYGTDNKNKDGMKLFAQSLSFRCPITNKMKHFEADASVFFKSYN